MILENECRNYFMINLHKVWDRARIELSTPGSAVTLASDARHDADYDSEDNDDDDDSIVVDDGDDSNGDDDNIVENGDDELCNGERSIFGQSFHLMPYFDNVSSKLWRVCSLTQISSSKKIFFIIVTRFLQL